MDDSSTPDGRRRLFAGSFRRKNDCTVQNSQRMYERPTDYVVLMGAIDDRKETP